ncbi:MAG: hypothetical protein R3B45_13410 [Bdellovibrionota bacterium]
MNNNPIFVPLSFKIGSYYRSRSKDIESKFKLDPTLRKIWYQNIPFMALAGKDATEKVILKSALNILLM